MPRKTADDFRKQARGIIDTIAKERDKLRKLLDEYSEVLETIEEASELFQDGLELISRRS